MKISELIKELQQLKAKHGDHDIEMPINTHKEPQPSYEYSNDGETLIEWFEL